jgi:cytochrome c biogenesis protein CcmG, thiol:disulfide interchange protein DsbE
VEGLPWLMVVSKTGRIAWYYSVASLGWPSTKTLIARVREALVYAGPAPATAAAAQAELSGSPPALAALHKQADQLLGSEPALAARVRSLRGYPIVINAWASWCVPCQSEFGLFASASANYGRQVAFLGADTNDSAGDAQSFLAQHSVSYPSYETSTSDMTNIIPQGVGDLPTTIFINRAGKLVYVHIGQYDSQGTLDADIASYALGG